MPSPKNTKIILISLFLICIGFESLAQTRSRSRRKIAPRPEYYKEILSREDTQTVTRLVLRNRLTILINELHTIPLVAIVTYVKAGAVNEADRAVGASDLLSRTLFSGTKKREGGRAYKDILAVGGKLTVRADYEKTLYSTVVPPDRISEALEIQAEALQNPTLSETDLRRNSEAMVQEGAQKYRDARAFASDSLYELAFDNKITTPMHTAGGDRFKSITREQVVRFYQDYYSANNLILSICGDLNSEAVVKDVVRYFSAMAKREIKKSPPKPEPQQTQLRYREVRGAVSQAYLTLGFHTPGVLGRDYHPLLLLSKMLGQGDGSILNRRLKENMKIVTSIASEFHAVKSTGMFLLQSQLDPQNLDKAELAVLTEIEALKKDGISDQDLNRALTLSEESVYRKQETVEARAEILASFEDLGSFKLADNQITGLRQVTPEDIQRVLENYFKLNNCSILEYQPGTSEPRGYTPDSFRQTIGQILPPAVAQRLQERPPDKALMELFKPSSETNKFVPRQLIFQVTRASIRAGPEIFIKEDHTLPSISVGLFFAGGRLQEDETNSGITELMLRALLEEDDKRGPNFITRQLEIWGGEISPVVEDDYFGFLITILSKNIEGALKLLLERIKDPKFERAELSLEKTAQVSEIRADKDDVALSAVELFKKAAFGKHPYSLPRHGLEHIVKNLSGETLDGWYREHMAKTKPIIAIIGDTEGSSLASFFARNIKTSEFQNIKVPNLKEMKLDAASTEKEQRNQQITSVVVGFRLAETMAESIYPLDVLKDLVSEREAGNTKTMGGLLGGAIYTYRTGPPESEAESLQAAKTQFAKLKNGNISAEDFKRSISSTIGSYQIAMQDRVTFIKRIIENYLLGRGYDELSEYAGKIRSIAIDDLKSVVQRLINSEHQAVGIVRGVPTTQSSMRPTENYK